jgi:hypothetical protein
MKRRSLYQRLQGLKFLDPTLDDFVRSNEEVASRSIGVVICRSPALWMGFNSCMNLLLAKAQELLGHACETITT